MHEYSIQGCLEIIQPSTIAEKKKRTKQNGIAELHQIPNLTHIVQFRSGTTRLLVIHTSIEVHVKNV